MADMIETSAGPIPRADAKPKKEPLTIEDIPTYRRPFGAQQVLGETDELGNPVYRMPSGKKITLVQLTGEEGEQQAAADKWPLGKAASDARELLWDFIQNPEVPSWSQIKQLPSAIVQGMQETMDMPTPANILGTAAGMGAGGAATTVPEGSLRIFGGRKAKGGHINLVEEEARQRLGSLDDLTPDELWDSFGIFQGLDGQMRFEIPDVDAKVTSRARDIWSNEVSKTPTAIATTWEMDLSDFLDHPILFEEYPELATLPIRFVQQPGSTWQGAFINMDDGIEIYPGNIRGGGKDPDNLLATIYHELQHAVQEIEGFDSGSNPRMVNPSPTAIAEAEQAITDVVRAVEFLDPLQQEGREILGRALMWHKVEDEKIIQRASGMTDQELSMSGLVFDDDGVLKELKSGMFTRDSDGNISVVKDSGEASWISLLNQTSIPSVYDNYYSDIAALEDKVSRGLAFKWEYNGKTYYQDSKDIVDPRKLQNKLINKGLTADFVKRVATDGRPAIRRYLATAGEIEAETVVRRYKRGRMATQYIPSELRNAPWFDKTHPYIDLNEYEQRVADGEAIRRPQIPEDE